MTQILLTDVSKIYPDGTTAVSRMNLEIESGEFMAMLGPSGCGKSTTLRMVAGLEEVSSGTIMVDGEDVVGTPARDRDIAMVFENYALYPHLDAFRNIAMPLVARKTPKHEIRQRVRRIADIMGIADHLGKRPSKLSGGQRQRVALARAMVRRPRIFLMDEPLGHLEEYLRVELRREIRALHESTGGTTFYITHDQEEAAAVSDRIAVLDKGVLQQVGTMAELFDCPSNRFVAEFVGELPISIFDNISIGDGVLQLGDHRVALPRRLARATASRSPVSAGIRPEHFTIANAEASGLPAQVQSVQPTGERGIVLCRTAVGEATVVAPSSQLPEEGEAIRLHLDRDRLHLFADDGQNILGRGD